MKKIIVFTMALVSILFPALAGAHSFGGGMMMDWGGGYGMMAEPGYGGIGFLGWLISFLVIVLLVLAIIALIKYLKK